MRRPAAYPAEWRLHAARMFGKKMTAERQVINDDKAGSKNSETKRKRKNGRYISNARDTYGVLKKPGPFTPVTNEVVSFEGHECDIKRRFVVSHR